MCPAQQWGTRFSPPQEQLAVERELEVDAPVVDAPVRVDPERQRMGEIALGQKRLECLDVLR